MLKAVLTAFVCLVVSIEAGAQTKKAAQVPKQTAAKPQKSALDKATFEAYIRHSFMLPENLKVIVQDPKPSDLPGMVLVNVTVTDGGPMSQNVEFFVSKDGLKILQGKVYDVRESPFAADLKLLRTDGTAIMGSPAAPVTLVVFSDFQCQYCREEAKTLRQNLAKDFPVQAKLVFKDFPLEQIHPWAKQASIAGRCIARTNANAFWEYHDWIFEQQPQVTVENLKGKILEYATGKGLDTLQLTQCMDGKLTEKDVEASAAEARALQVASTPTLFVNGRRLVGNVTWDQLKKIIEYELDYSKKSSAEKKDEACCEIKLPIPVQK